MTYTDALKAVENGQNVRLWTGEEYLHPEYVKQTLDNLSTALISLEHLKTLLKSSKSDDWEIYTKESLEWEVGQYRFRLEHLGHAYNILIEKLLGKDYYNEYMSWLLCKDQTAADALHALYNLKRSLKIFRVTTIIFFITTIIALIV